MIVMFDINLECDRKNGYVYFIENPDEIRFEGFRSWLLNAFSVSNLINDSRYVKERILLEDIPSGERFLTPIIEAMRDGVIVRITHQGFQNDKSHIS